MLKKIVKKLKQTIKNKKVIKVVRELRILTFVYSIGKYILEISNYSKDFI